MANSKILVLITGGTIDKDYQETTGQLTFVQSHLPELFQQANHSLTLDLQNLMLKDSLEMTEQDRLAIVQACESSDAEHIVITHGTDTMTASAEALSASKNLNNKTIVLTGAMRPFKLGNSDASFNIGTALMAVQLANNGIYIAMNGQLFSAGNVSKNTELGQFEQNGN